MAQINVKGMSVGEILNMDINTFNKLDTRSMRSVLTRLNSAANKRITRLEKAGADSPALRSVQSSGGRFSVKGKDLNELRSEYSRARSFMEMRTSSVTGWRNVQRDTIKALRAKGVQVTKDSLDEVIKIYERLKEIDPSVANAMLKYKVMEEASKLDDDLSMEERVDVMRERLVSIYEAQAELEDDFDGFSNFFEM